MKPFKPLTKQEAQLFLSNGKRGRKPKYDWASIVHKLMAGASVKDVAREEKMAPSYVSSGAKKYAKGILAAK
jgi:hypothetical protein